MTAGVFLAVAIMAAVLSSTGASALECVGVEGVFRYCPGKVCIKQPCYIIER
jgi:hypothetical protein